MIRFLTVLLLTCGMAGPGSARDLTVFAAASLKEPLDRIAADFGGVTVSYGGSGTLARQVSFGAPADVVLLANQQWMDVLVDEGAVAAQSVAVFASNALVLVGGAEADPVALTPEGFAAGLGAGPLAMGFVTSVPAGIYGKAALETLGLWDLTEGRLAEVDSVRGALALVARGEAPLGVVYASDLRVVPGVAAVAEFPKESHPAIAYTAAETSGRAHPEAAAFVAALTGAAAQDLLMAAGFCAAEGC